MNIKNVKYVDIVAEFEEEGYYYDFTTSYVRQKNGTYKKSFSTTNDKCKLCPQCGSWNISDNHECEDEYVAEQDIIDEVDDIYGDDNINIYINKVLI